MKLISAELTNFCQHRSVQAKFAPGLTAIIGRNGSGKSNLVKGIYATITGDFGRNDGVKTDNISQFALATAQSRIQVVFEHCNSTMTIVRSLRPIATRLRIDAAGAKTKTITKSQESTEAIASIVGVSARMLADYVFVDQWSIFDFLSMMPSERAKAFQRLFRTERAEALWKIIGDHYDSIIIPTPGISKDVVIKRLTDNRGQHAIYSEGIEKLVREIALQDPARLRQVWADYQHRQWIEGEVKTLKSRQETIKYETKTISVQIKSLAVEDTTLADCISTERDIYLRNRQLSAGWATYNAIERNRQNISNRLAKCKCYQQEPIKPIDYIAPEFNPETKSWYETYNTINMEAFRLQKLVDTIKSGVTVCDSCGMEITDATNKLTEFIGRLKFVTDMKQTLHKIRHDSRTYDWKLKEYQEAVQAAESIRIDNELQLAELADVPKPEQSCEELDTAIKHYEDSFAKFQQTHKVLEQLRLQEQRHLIFNEQIEEEIARKANELETMPVTKEIAEAAKLKLEEHEKSKSQKITLEANLAALNRLIHDDEVMIEHLEKIEAEAVVTREWANYCLKMRNIVHRDNLPRLVAQNYLELMQDEINNLLIRFDSSFNVKTDESLSFVATFKDGRCVPASRLSGGEKVLLALAFRVAVNDIFAKDLGLLVLDEPTSGLDEGNIACLKIAIQRLKELSAARGLQVIMITHERELHNLFDHVIEIGKDI